MDDVSIHIDELVVDGSSPRDEEALLAALRHHMKPTPGPVPVPDWTFRELAGSLLAALRGQYL